MIRRKRENPVSTCPNADLWWNVITQACVDAFRGSAADENSRAAEHYEAVAFLTARTGSWLESREAICDALGLDPDALRESAIAIIEGRRKFVFTDGSRVGVAEPRRYYSNAGVLEARHRVVLERAREHLETVRERDRWSLAFDPPPEPAASTPAPAAPPPAKPKRRIDPKPRPEPLPPPPKPKPPKPQKVLVVEFNGF